MTNLAYAAPARWAARGTSDRTLSPWAAYAVPASVVGLALFASSTPSALYGTYQQLWGFSPLVLTLIYATYAFGVLTSLLLAGSVSDRVGRRPVLLVALLTLIGTTGLFIVADSVAWLFVARGVQGLATGLAIGAASAALLDLHPRRDPNAVGLTSGVVSTAGQGFGVLVSAVLVQLLPAPRVLPYVLLAGLFAAVFAAALRMPEPIAERKRLRLTPQRPSVPAAVRRPFLIASLAAVAAWGIGGVFVALGPSLSVGIFHTTNHVVTSLGVFVLTGTAALSQLVIRRSVPWIGTVAGSVVLAAGMLVIVVAVASDAAALFLVGAAIGGAGFGAANLGGLRTLTRVIPPEHRASVLSAYFVVAYAALSLPAILAGVLATPLGLQQTFEILGSVVAGVALLVAVAAAWERPWQASR
jgi:MFS family permease